jgi:hypothetical protein
MAARPTPHRVPRHGVAFALVLVAGSTVLAACSNGPAPSPKASPTTTTAAPAPTPPTSVHYPHQVALFGDSLAWEAQPYWTAFIHEDDEAAVTADTFGGTATCDFLNRMREVEAKDHPVAVELLFSGNNLTPCMKGLELYTDPYYQAYRENTLAAIRIFSTGATHVYLIGAPITKKQVSIPGWQRLNQLYAQIAQGDPSRVTYVNAGQAVEGPGGTFTETLPCIEGQPCTGPVVDGTRTDVVRAPDGTHFCPAKEGDVHGVIDRCPVYSAGAYRFAQAMVAPLATTGPTNP